jgi:FKBP-type peptidyl-prolyl cis-trans isomerase FkpA
LRSDIKNKKMKNLFMALFAISLLSCNSDDDLGKTDYTAENEQEIVEYIAQHNLTATRTNSGLYYVIDEVGTGAEIIATSDVSVIYKGTFKDGSVFDESTEDGVSFNLQEVIQGWTEGIQLFNEGGSGILLIPSHLAYGSSSNRGIPGGSVLIFEVALIDYAAKNEQEIVAYIEDNQLDATRTDSGLYYVIDVEGTGDAPLETSNVSVKYKGYFTNGTVFDENLTSSVTFDLEGVISGWTEGVQNLKVGGSGKLLIPSHLGYGRYGRLDQSGNEVIPEGAVLIFEIELVSIN